MGLLTLVEDRPTPRAVYNWRVYFCATVASFAACMIGYDSAFIGTTLALPSFRAEFQLTNLPAPRLALISSNIVSVYQAGAFFGALSAYIFAYYLGRKKSLYIYAAVFQLGSGLMMGANRERGLGLIYGGRVLAGLGVGGASMLVPIYISELSPPAIRGRLVGIYELGWQIGGLVGFWINYGLVEHTRPGWSQWIVPFAVQLIPGGLLLVGTFFLRESPRWLLTKNRREEALKNLCWVRNLDADDIYIVEEVGLIDAAITADTSRIGSGFGAPFKAAIRDKKVLYRLWLGSMLFLWQNGSGINAVNYYSPTVFRSLGLTGTSTGFLTTGLFGVVKTTLTFVWLLYLIDHLGRRALLLIGAAGGSVCMWIIGAYVYKSNPSANATGANASLTSGGIAAIFFFYLWTAFYTPSWNGTPWVLNSEMFDSATRPLGQASAAASNWLWNFLISRFTPQMFLKMGRSGCGVYFFFATMMIVSIFFVFFLVPETKSVPLEYMDRLFEVKPIWRANKLVLDEVRLRDEEFRHDAEGADLTVAKEKADKLERTSDV
ncbi:Sugar (and other) transporter-like protein 6 [Elsinoe fawcettii]|nr:Sugar (and other) transporter-like protein 6 [Elsinoe fawcettii]